MAFPRLLSMLANKLNASAQIPLTAAGSAVTGTLPVANGGTGASSITANAVVIGAGTGAVTTVSPGANKNVLTSNGTSWTSAAPASSGVTGGFFVGGTGG